MKDTISIKGIEVFAHHGVFEEEKETGQTFTLDIDLAVDLSRAGSSDRLEDTIDYGSLASDVHSLVQSTRHDLIEKVAAEVAEMILGDEKVAAVEVTVHKPGAPIDVPFGDVAVTIRRER